MARLRVIVDGPRTGQDNMYWDESLLEAFRPEDDPILRVYRWWPPAVSFGYNQKEADFDPEAVAQRGYGIVRRPTGGRAILHADEITYCVVGASPSELFGDSLHSTYMKINEALVQFLKDLGLQPEISGGEAAHELRGALCFKSAGQHEIRVGGRKLIGSAQRRKTGIFLQHGSILTGPTHAELVDCVIPERQTISKEQLLALTTDLGQLLGKKLTAEDLDGMEKTLVEAFVKTFGLEPEVMRFGGMVGEG
jgi:lipoyl(octanoyl) transferase